MNKLLGSDKIDLNNPNELSEKVTSERETRKKFLTVAHWAGRDQDMLLVFAKFDKLLRNCDDDAKRKDISKVGAIEVYKLLGECFSALKNSSALQIPGLDSHSGELWVDGELVYKDR